MLGSSISETPIWTAPKGFVQEKPAKVQGRELGEVAWQQDMGRRWRLCNWNGFSGVP